MAHAINDMAAEVVGSSDSGQVLLLDKLLPRIPLNPKFVYVRRRAAEVIPAFARVTGIPGNVLAPVIARVDAALNEAQLQYPGLVVPYESLGEEGTIRKIWAHVMPLSMAFPDEHYHAIKNVNIQPDPEKLRAQMRSQARCALSDLFPPHNV